MDLSWIWGQAQTSFHHHPETITLKSKQGSSLSLSELCRSITPPCRLNPLLFNGHLQTCWSVVKSEAVPVFYKRKVFEAEDPAYFGSFAVDFVVPPYKENDATLPSRTTYFEDDNFELIASLDEKPMLVTLHGLSGGSHELYLRSVLHPLFEEGWEACVVNSRGCAESRLTSGVLYNGRSTWDIRQIVKWLSKTFPNRPLFAVGFSLGANILANYLGEEGSECMLKAAVVCSNPWNCEAGSLALQRTWLGLEVYSKAMGTSMRLLFEKHFDQISKNPRIDAAVVAKVRGIKYLHEFDRELQAPTWGYPTEGAYYRDVSSTDSLLAVRIPLFAIHAEDDPVALKEALPLQEFKCNPFAVLCTTSLGGHLSWFETGGGRWFAKPVTQFFMKMASEIDLTRIEIHSNSHPPSFNPMRRKVQMHA